MNDHIEVLRGLVAEIGDYVDQQVEADLDVIENWRQRLDAALAAMAARREVGADANAWRAVAAEAFREWDADNDSRVGKLLRAMADPEFAKKYRQDIAVLHTQPEAQAGGAVSAEDRFEQFVQQAIAKSPEPLRELGEYLSSVLDEDEWPKADRLMLQLATNTTTPPPGAVPEVPEGWMRDAAEVEALASHLENIAWRANERGDVDCHDQAAAMAAEVLRKVLLPRLAAAPGPKE